MRTFSLGVPILLVAVLMLSACSAFYRSAPESKMDVRLRQAVAAEPGVIAFSGECSEVIDDAVKVRLEAAGVTVETVTGKLFTARGESEAVKRMAALECVVRLQAAKPVKPLSKQGGQS